MKIRVNEKEYEAEEGSTVEDLRLRAKPEADVALIRRGEAPPREELEGLLAAHHQANAVVRLLLGEDGEQGATL